MVHWLLNNSSCWWWRLAHWICSKICVFLRVNVLTWRKALRGCVRQWACDVRLTALPSSPAWLATSCPLPCSIWVSSLWLQMFCPNCWFTGKICSCWLIIYLAHCPKGIDNVVCSTLALIDIFIVFFNYNSNKNNQHLLLLYSYYLSTTIPVYP